MWPFRKKVAVDPDPGCIQHEVRNAVLGIQLERRRLWQAHNAADTRIKAHLERIEEALKK